MDARDTNTGRSDRLSQYVKSVRRGLNLSLRSVEEASGNQVSNAYLSQLESGKIRKPSPHILYALSTALGVSYEDLMERGRLYRTSQWESGGDETREGSNLLNRKPDLRRRSGFTGSSCLHPMET